MRIYIASDHAGFELKKILSDFLREQGEELVDLGPVMLEPQDDYPDYIERLAERVAGEAMAANRVRGARAAEYYGGDLEVVKVSREHNDANILSLGARFITGVDAKKAVLLFIHTPFSGEERHQRRINKLDC